VKTESVALAAHRKLGTTTLAWLWLVSRTDGTVFGFTDVDRDITYVDQNDDPFTYAAATGLTPSALQARVDLSVQNMEVAGALDSASITLEDLSAGKWDNATVWVADVNWRDLSMGHMLIKVGTIGNVRAGRDMFWAELRGLMQVFQQAIGSLFSVDCRANWGDPFCGKDAEASRRYGAVTSVLTAVGFGSDLTGDDDQSGAGLLRWETGANAGTQIEVNTDDGAGNLTLMGPPPNMPQVGDTFSVIDGCRKRFGPDCRDKHDNVIRFRGEPYAPLNGFALGNAGLETSNG
jgi:uncharacterized phage protein (TIGR02218 family)